MDINLCTLKLYIDVGRGSLTFFGFRGPVFNTCFTTWANIGSSGQAHHSNHVLWYLLWSWNLEVTAGWKGFCCPAPVVTWEVRTLAVFCAQKYVL